jgi:hypothetical protein
MQPTQPGQFFGIKVSKANVNVNYATDQQLVFKNDFSTQTFYDASNSRIMLGLLPDGTYGLVISKPGINVTTVFS